MKPTVTRTLGPLHLEDLEPHRFEDLVRQLAYDFRHWLRLEATGRSGGDDGFDARGVEALAAEADEEEGAAGGFVAGNVWIVQCKRERAIAKAKITGYLADLEPIVNEGAYGLIFAAACDFSKTTRDAFFAGARELGLQEAHLWGKAEIEDMLFQPRNDHLLFAYFGISLVMRRRAIQSVVRARLAAKRKLLRMVPNGGPVLIRDASDERYPVPDPDTTKKKYQRRRWRVAELVGCRASGAYFLVRRHFAWLGEDGEGWDYSERTNNAQIDPWEADEQVADRRDEVWAEWQAFPERERAWFTAEAVVPYDNIIDIDEEGDEFFKGPHIYVSQFRDDIQGPFVDLFVQLVAGLTDGTRREGDPRVETRMCRFSALPSREVAAAPAAAEGDDIDESAAG